MNKVEPEPLAPALLPETFRRWFAARGWSPRDHQLELLANTTRADALRNFVARSRDMEMRKFANLLIDTDRFGTSLGPALKTHARYLRIRFRQIAQEKARKVGVKLIFPVFFLIFPSVILVTLGPAVILIFTQMKNLLGQ